MKTLYVTDMDGTLLNSASQVSQRSATIISELSRRGALITVATARTPATVVPLLIDTYTTIPAIVMTGVALWNRQEKRYDHPQFIEQKDVETIIGTYSHYNIAPFAYNLDEDSMLQVYHSAETLAPWDQEFYDARCHLALKKFHLNTDVPEEAKQRLVLFFGMGPCEEVFKLAEELKSTTSCSVTAYHDIFNKDIALIEIFRGGVSKAQAIQRLAKQLGADRVVAFGDNLNDIPMLKIADEAVAVENAFAEVKAIADITIGANNDDAVARFIAHDMGMDDIIDKVQKESERN
jgi:hypothetical protein